MVIKIIITDDDVDDDDKNKDKKSSQINFFSTGKSTSSALSLIWQTFQCSCGRSLNEHDCITTQTYQSLSKFIWISFVCFANIFFCIHLHLLQWYIKQRHWYSPINTQRYHHRIYSFKFLITLAALIYFPFLSYFQQVQYVRPGPQGGLCYRWPRHLWSNAPMHQNLGKKYLL